MAHRGFRLTRRALCSSALSSSALGAATLGSSALGTAALGSSACGVLALLGSSTVAREAHGFGEEGAFHPRLLLTGTRELDKRRRSAPGRWSAEVVRRTSAPAVLAPRAVRADSPTLWSEPFAVWAGAAPPEALTEREVFGLRKYLGLGGLLLVDELDPDRGAFLAGAKIELARVIPDGAAIAIGEENVVFRSFYLLRRATGRVDKASKLSAILRGGMIQVIFSPNDLLGALAREAGGVGPFEVVPGGEAQREQACRLAVNIAMYVLCSNYKDDQVHAPFLMRRRGQKE